MNEVLLIVHLVALAMAMGTGGANPVVIRVLGPGKPETIKLLGALRRTTGIGLALLWLSGLGLVWSKYDGFGSLPTAFWWKFAFVVLITVAYGITVWETRKPGPPRI